MAAAETWYGLLLVIAVRYFLIAGVAYLLWYKLWRNKLGFKKIQSRFPKSADYKREIFFSVITILIFTVVPAAMLFTPFSKYTLYYKDLHQYNWLWFWLAFPLMFIVHDTYFYCASSKNKYREQ